MWEWLSGLSGGAATFIGSLTGSLIGLLALLAGALFNAHLNRRRDDRLRKDETRAIATAIQAELLGIHRTLVDNATDLKKPDHDKDFIIPDLACRDSVKSQLVSKLGLLEVETIRSMIDAYIIIEQYGGHLVMRGGTRGSQEHGQQRLIAMTADKKKLVVTLSEVTAEAVEKAIRKLDKFL